MARQILSVTALHSSIQSSTADFHSEVISAAQSAVLAHDVVILGMAQNPFPRKARRLLDARSTQYHYLAWGSYFSQWKQRLAIKMWTGWATFPQIFVKGTFIGGYSDLKRLSQSGELDTLLKAPRP